MVYCNRDRNKTTLRSLLTLHARWNNKKIFGKRRPIKKRYLDGDWISLSIVFKATNQSMRVFTAS